VKISRRFSTGRLNRRNFALGILIEFLISLFIIEVIEIETLISTVWERAQNKLESILLVTLFLAYIVIMVFIHATLVLRRLHDIGIDIWTGEHGHKIWPYRWTSYNWFYLLQWTLFPLFYLKGENKENKYGKPPEPKIDLKGLFGFS
jgi:uncharacterized membrane protein YhaH (DUF805 family)